MAIEFSRDITFGQYLDLGSPVHRRDPRMKILAVGILMFATIIARSFSAVLVLYLCAALIQWRSTIPLSYTLRGMRLLVTTLLIIFVFQVLFFPNPSNALWQWWILSISWDGLSLGILIILRVVLLYYWTSTLMFTTALMDLADGMEIMLDPLKRLRVPVNEVVMTFVIALKFVPLLVAELERLIKARTARGERFDKGNLMERGRKIGSVLVPLFVNALARAEVLTTAMNARCYRGGQGRTKRRVLSWRTPDTVMLLIALAFAVLSFALGRMALL
ncbi:energy-coupling factor transporter transmembrane protein EcfT [Candidatus Gracilibacteria bacterium]|nr:energy-coupling factor transporter transmembrane protein EcfT [Candidatus Gracilibacteria bacterium]